MLSNVTLQSSLAVDGVLDGECATTQLQPQPYWRVDLLEERQVHAVELLVQANTGTHLTSSPLFTPIKSPRSGLLFDIEIWTENSVSERLMCAKYRGRLEPNMLHTFMCEQPIEFARRVQVTALDQTALRLCEVLVLSTKSGKSCV
jgi:hypothetical protein